jgi:hypothetical protein
MKLSGHRAKSGAKVDPSALDPGFTQTPVERELGIEAGGRHRRSFFGGGAWARPVLAPEERRWSSDVFPYGDL